MTAKPDPEEVARLVNRLRRIEGQVRGLYRMIGDGSACEDVLTQLAATRAALDRVGVQLIVHRVRECLLEEEDITSEEAVRRALEAFQKYAQYLQSPPGAGRSDRHRSWPPVSAQPAQTPPDADGP